MKSQENNPVENKEICALVLGGYINGFSIISELWNKGIKNIVLFDTSANISSHSNKIIHFRKTELSGEKLTSELIKLNSIYKKIIIYPTEDFHIENLHFIYDSIKDFCFIPFNHHNILMSMNKVFQYECCEKLGVPFPKSIPLEEPDDIQKLLNLEFPIIIKSQLKEAPNSDIFRNITFKNNAELGKFSFQLEQKICEGHKFFASEIIPGKADNLYAYVGYRSKKGEILNDWALKKLSQYPDNFGTFATATNEAPPIIYKLGKTLLNGMNLMGICEAEFKFDPKNKDFKLIEINMRPVMLNAIGHLSGVDLMYTQYLDALGESVPKQNQITNKKIHLVNLFYEVSNLITGKNYWKVFKHNLFGGDKIALAGWDKNDFMPFLFLFLDIPKRLMKKWFNLFAAKQ